MSALPSNPRTSDALEQLATTAREAARSYRNTALAADAPRFRGLATQLSLRHQGYLRDLERFLQAPGASRDAQESALGFWIDVTPAFAHSDDARLSASCLSFNERCRETYEEVLERLPLAEPARSLVACQLGEISEATATLRELAERRETIAA